MQEVLDPIEIVRHEQAFTAVFARNMAGIPRLEITGLEQGAILRLRPAEYLADGHADQCSTGSPIVHTFTSAGTETVWQPCFGYHGFQYLEIEQLDAAGNPVAPDPERIRVQALRVMADDRPTGTLQLGDPVLLGIDTLITNAAQSNLMTVPTDCPHREKLGWRRSRSTARLAPTSWAGSATRPSSGFA